MIRKVLLLAVALVCTPLPTTVEAQVRLPVQPPYRQLGPAKSQEDSQPIPPAYRPPPGMCRIWLDNVPASQQPASTDCVSAVRNRPNNARVIFGDDYVEKRGRGKDKDRDKNKKPESHVDAGDIRLAEPLEAVVGPRRGVAFALAPRVHGPQWEDDVTAYDARPLDEPGVVAFMDQPPARRQPSSPAARRAQARDSARRDAAAERDRVWREPALRGRSAAELSEQRRALRERLRDDRVRRGDRDDRDDDFDDDDRWDDRSGRGTRSGVPLGRGNGYGVYGNGGYGNGGYGNGYGYYPPPGRANGVCLDRDGDGWCDDSRTGGGYCIDRDGDGRCDDYPDLASAPYSSSMPPMAAAMDVQRGRGSQLALRWLGTAEVMVRTSELRRTGTPYRAMWLDANTGRLLQVWTDRDGDGIADRVEIYRNGRVAKILGR
jgi:hypothetical protein